VVVNDTRKDSKSAVLPNCLIFPILHNDTGRYIKLRNAIEYNVCYMRYSMIIYNPVTVYNMIKGTVKYYEKETKTGKKAGQLSLKDAFASVLPFKNAEELYAEYDPEKKTLTIREL